MYDDDYYPPHITVTMTRRRETFKDDRYHLGLDFKVTVPDIGTTDIYMSCVYDHSQRRVAKLSKSSRVSILCRGRNYPTFDWVQVLKWEIQYMGLASDRAKLTLILPETEEVGIFKGKDPDDDIEEEEGE